MIMRCMTMVKNMTEVDGLVENQDSCGKNVGLAFE